MTHPLTADGRTLARAALISCCTISHTELSEGAELAEAGSCVENDAVEWSICGGSRQGKGQQGNNFLCCQNRLSVHMRCSGMAPHNILA